MRNKKNNKMEEKKMEKVDLERIKNGIEFINVNGIISEQYPKRIKLIEEAINDVQTGFNHLKKEYYGIKNYGQFGDQRADCSYGMGPTHGSIVFEIELTSKARKNIEDINTDDVYNIVYTLEAVRDFGYVEQFDIFYGNHGRDVKVGLIKLLKHYLKSQNYTDTLKNILDNAKLENNQKMSGTPTAKPSSEADCYVATLTRGIPVDGCSIDTSTHICLPGETVESLMAWVEEQTVGSAWTIRVEITKAT